MSSPKVIRDIKNRVLRSGDTMLGSFFLTGDPAQDLEASSKKYVDTALESYLHRAGNQSMFGHINFAPIASWPTIEGETYPIESAGLYWSGSSDWVRMLYRVNAPDSGQLVIRLGDDTGCNFIVENSLGTAYALINKDGITATNFIGNASTATKLQNSVYIFSKAFDGANSIAGQPLVYGQYTSASNSRYFYSGIQIRENDLVGNSQTDAGYAPSIGFHWSGRVGGSMYYHHDQNFYFKKQDGTTRASLDANLIGNASTASKLATARNINITGAINGSANFDGSNNITIDTQPGFVYNENLGGRWYHVDVGNSSEQGSNWYKLFEVSHPSGYGTYEAYKVSGYIYKHNGNWNQSCQQKIPFVIIMNISGDSCVIYSTVHYSSSFLRVLKRGTRSYEIQFSPNQNHVNFDIFYQVNTSGPSNAMTYYTSLVAATNASSGFITSCTQINTYGNYVYSADTLDGYHMSSGTGSMPSSAANSTIYIKY